MRDPPPLQHRAALRVCQTIRRVWIRFYAFISVSRPAPGFQKLSSSHGLMSKSLKQKSRLKAADRRRRRRPIVATAPNHSGAQSSRREAASESIDVAGILTDAVMRIAEKTPELKDSAVIGALRAIIKETSPNSTYTDTVYSEMVLGLDAANIPPTDRRSAAKDLLSLALVSVDPDDPTRLVKSYAWIAS